MDTPKTVTHIGLCAGYGGIELGLQRAIPNLRTVALCEIEAFAIANLVAKMEAGLMDPAPIWPNLKTFPWGSFRGRVDILTGGYPCQPFSSAGKRRGGEDPRHLWPYISDGIRILRPALCFFENVEGHITQGLHYVLCDLGELGYRTTWGLFSAAECGAPHSRKRVFILAHNQRQRIQELGWQIAGTSKLNTTRNTGCEKLADTGCKQPQGWRCFAEGQQSGAGRISWGESAPCHDQVWPSRPGEQQYGWEPPRVVGNSEELQFNGGNDNRGSNFKSQKRDESCQLSGQFGNADDDKRECSSRRQTQSTLGGDSDGTAGRLDDAQLYVSCDNSTDELRLLGNGVVPATAEKAFRTLIEELSR